MIRNPETVTAAKAAFWCEVAMQNPTAITGDLSPTMLSLFDTVTAAAIAEWVATNVPAVEATEVRRGQFVAIAMKFALVLGRWLTRSQMLEVVRLNATSDYMGLCASHNHCDANMAMAEAFEACGVPTCLDYDAESIEHQAACDLWDLAWTYAKANSFFTV